MPHLACMTCSNSLVSRDSSCQVHAAQNWVCRVNIFQGLCSVYLSNSLLWFWKNVTAFREAMVALETWYLASASYFVMLAAGLWKGNFIVSMWAIGKPMRQLHLLYFYVLNKQQHGSCLKIQWFDSKWEEVGWVLSEQAVGMKSGQIQLGYYSWASIQKFHGCFLSEIYCFGNSFGCRL